MVEINNKTRSKLNLALIKTIVKNFLFDYQISQERVSIVFVGDVLIRKFNKQYRGFDKITDVLSFRDKDSMSIEPNYLGEIIIDYQQIKRQAKRLGHGLQKELTYILVHGLLHLVGYDDQTVKGADQMHKLAIKFINQHQYDKH